MMLEHNTPIETSNPTGSNTTDPSVGSSLGFLSNFCRIIGLNHLAIPTNFELLSSFFGYGLEPVGSMNFWTRTRRALLWVALSET